MGGEQGAVFLRGVLRPAVGVKDAAWGRAAQGDGALERRHGQPRVDAAAEGVADDPPRPGVEHDREIDEARGDRDIGDVGDPELVGTLHLEVLCDEREDRPVMIAVGGAHEARPAAGTELMFLHQASDLLDIDHAAPVAELGADPAVAVSRAGLGDRPDLGEDRVLGGPRPGRGIVARSRHAHQLASLLDGEATGPLITDMGALLGEGLARKAPFKNSISSAWRPTSRSSAPIFRS